MRRQSTIVLFALAVALGAGVAACGAAAGDVTEDGATTTGLTRAPAGAEAPTTSIPSTSVPTTTTTAATTTTTAPPRSFTMAFTGDVLIHSRVWEVASRYGQESGRAFDFRPMLEPTRAFTEDVDWAVCHLEVTLSSDGTRLSSYPMFRAPGEVAFDLAEVGYDSCSTASNHSLDTGPDGLVETAHVLEAAGLRFTGTARTPEEAWDSIWYQIGGVRVAHLSYSCGFNGLRPPADAPWMVRRIDEELIAAETARARSEGAEVVILSLHWGDEYVHAPNAQQRDLGPRLLASPDIDLIIGHHAHVVQPIERIEGKWLVYGVGNLLHNMSQPVRRDELLVRIHVAEADDGSFSVEELEVVPLYVDNRTLEVLPAGPTLRPPDVSADLAAELDASWARTLAVLQDGSGWEDLVVVG